MLTGPGEQKIAGAFNALEKDTGAREQRIDPIGLRRPNNSVKKVNQVSLALGVLGIPLKEKTSFSPHQ